MIQYENIRSVHLEISTRCNASCPECPRNFRGVNNIIDTYPITDMSLDQFQKIFPRDFISQLNEFYINGNHGDFVTARDAGRCNVLALQSEANDEFYNVGTGIQTSIGELCDLILELRTSDLKVSFNPYNAEDARRLVQNRIGSPEKASKDLGFMYEDDLRSGLLNLINWRNNNQGRF
jgi:nucleoside-diphosphate-sugar epimerase